ncbi:hypothetical protein [Gordonia sp. (in: high G+C Gram-positive bacteria)]|mgnify:CR=1 FL=1|uniref:hypothetical protein n=1 Tax=Gordonia sp. (in: high G+C Gram-positive bacteria) TaxID=84139 RepID=UPI00168EC584|nr:hypothetical protein [Gordonia sp. (in: high G+C Gram-positive bacteria)]NLG45285.1 hypothetical protein [Gordonia sp. (in: high G+C Gram-positive bacteria)]
MTRTMKLAATTLFGISLAFAATACGSENEAPSDPNTPATSAQAPSGNSSVPVVAGPKPRSGTTSAASTVEGTSEDGNKTCGATKGPDGALYIHVVQGDVSCDTAKTIANEYGPLIATGKAQTVSGWDCGPATNPGELARCSKGSQAFSLMVQ